MLHLLLLLFLFALPSSLATPGPKRGASLEGGYTCNDLNALNLGDSWYYNWDKRPDPSYRCSSSRIANEFVPMIWSCGSSGNCWSGLPSDYKTQWANAGVKYLLGFNEPDLSSQSNMSPHQAATLWPQVQDIANSMNPPLILVSPAMAVWNHNEGCSAWMTQFLGNCSVISGCDPNSIKYLAFHDYSGSPSWVTANVQSCSQKFGNRPIWLTEFAGYSGESRSGNDNYMKQVLPALDSSPYVVRYAWFSTRNTPGSLQGNLFNPTSNPPVLTSTGTIYSQANSTSPFDWEEGSHCEWAYNCDFSGNDISHEQIASYECSNACYGYEGCTNFAWNEYEGGTCWLKSGNLPESAAFANYGDGQLCGVMT